MFLLNINWGAKLLLNIKWGAELFLFEIGLLWSFGIFELFTSISIKDDFIGVDFKVLLLNFISNFSGDGV